MKTKRPGILIALVGLEGLHGHRKTISNAKIGKACLDSKLIEEGLDCSVIRQLQNASAGWSFVARPHDDNTTFSNFKELKVSVWSSF
jgi:hypothetical protein